MTTTIDINLDGVATLGEAVDLLEARLDKLEAEATALLQELMCSKGATEAELHAVLAWQHEQSAGVRAEAHAFLHSAAQAIGLQGENTIQ